MKQGPLDDRAFLPLAMTSEPSCAKRACQNGPVPLQFLRTLPINTLRGNCRMSEISALIVDDSSVMRKIIERALRQAGLTIASVFEASSGLEALEVLRQQRVNLILSDINMPNMDGIELLTKIKEDAEIRTVPILMVTTEGNQARVMQALQLGAAGYVRKPFTADQIKEKLVGVI